VKRVAVIDSSPLINLVHLELALKLSQFFSLVYVPRQVQVEVNKKAKFRHRLNKLYEKNLFQKCVVTEDPVRVEFSGLLDPGEAESIQQAQELEATHLVIDEKRARKVGEAIANLRLVGTASILARLEREGLSGSTYSLVQKLRRDLRCRITDQLVERAIVEASRPI